MSRSLAALAASVLLLGTACAEPDQSATAPTGAGAPLLGRAGIPTPLAVTVADAGPNLEWHGIRSDGKGDYVDGQQGTAASIDGYGNLQFGVALSSAPARTLTFDFSFPVEPSNLYRPIEEGQQRFQLTTNPNGVAGTPKISDLGVNGNPDSACYNSAIAHRNATTRYEAYFNPDFAAQSIRVLITRTGSGTWTLAANVARCGPDADWAALFSQDLTTRKTAPLIFRGHYLLPVSMQLRAL
jgi:hypothetical protein